MHKKICFVSLGSLPLLSIDEKIERIGGGELKQVLIGKELAKNGFKISFITYDETCEKKYSDEITIIKSFSPCKNFSDLKKAVIIWKSLKKANADIYFQGNGPPGIIPLYCKLHGKKYVKWLTNDRILFIKNIVSNHTILTRMTTYFDIKFTHLIIAQNSFQKEIVKKKFKKKCVIINNPVVISDADNEKNIKNKNIILWVGNIRSIKQPELFLKLATSFPEYTFKLIGGESSKEKELFSEIKKKANPIVNLEFLGFVPHYEMKRYYEEASILINTSKSEGFPNTFLEAWTNKTPVISLNVDPDEVICNEKLGLHSKTFEQLMLDVKELLNNDKMRDEIGINAIKYVKKNHDFKKITKQFEDIITNLEK